MRQLSRPASLWRPYLAAAGAAVLLLGFVALNGSVAIFNDTRAYVRGGAAIVEALTHRPVASGWRSPGAGPPSPALSRAPTPTTAAAPQRYVTANRSIYYGLLALVGYLTGGFLLTASVQALCVATPMSLALMRGFGLPAGLVLATGLGLGLVTTAGPFVGYAMPDIFAGAAVFALALLATLWRRLLRLDRWVLAAIALVSAILHSGNPIILGSAGVCLLAAGWIVKRIDWRRAGLIGIACLVVGEASFFAFDEAAEKMTGQKPLMLPFVTAHLIDMGPGYRFLQTHCAGHPYEVCAYLPELPMPWDAFVGGSSRGPFVQADLAGKRRMSAEQIPLALRVIAYDPVGVTVGFMKDSLASVYRFGLINLKADDEMLAYYKAYMPESVSHAVERSALHRWPWFLPALTVIDYVVTLGSFACVLWLIVSARSRSRALGEAGSDRSAYVELCAVCFLAIVLNGAICGVLAGPADRYAARIVWIVPVLAVCGLSLERRARRRISQTSAPLPLATSE